MAPPDSGRALEVTALAPSALAALPELPAPPAIHWGAVDAYVSVLETRLALAVLCVAAESLATVVWAATLQLWVFPVATAAVVATGMRWMRWGGVRVTFRPGDWAGGRVAAWVRARKFRHLLNIGLEGVAGGTAVVVALAAGSAVVELWNSGASLTSFLFFCVIIGVVSVIVGACAGYGVHLGDITIALIFVLPILGSSIMVFSSPGTNLRWAMFFLGCGSGMGVAATVGIGLWQRAQTAALSRAWLALTGAEQRRAAAAYH